VPRTLHVHDAKPIHINDVNNSATRQWLRIQAFEHVLVNKRQVLHDVIILHPRLFQDRVPVV
jgi:hypothetical protein